MTATNEGVSCNDLGDLRRTPTCDSLFGELDVEALVDEKHQEAEEVTPLLPEKPLYEDSSPLSSICSNPEIPSVDLPDNVPFVKFELDEVQEEKKVDLLRPSTPQIETSRLQGSKVSPYFSKRQLEKISCIPFPPLDSSSFGLVQERLCHDPFQLLIAVLFLNKTRGAVSMPVFYNVIAHYPTPSDMAHAIPEDLMRMIHHLGLQNQRARKCISIAQAWLENPPRKNMRYRRLHYPRKNDGKDIQAREGPIDDEDPRSAWEVGHLPGIGAYAIDSWRIFCRDELRGLPTGLPDKLTPEATEMEMRKEWTRVLPLDKELRAYLRWRWLRLGWQWDPLTGNRKQVSPDFLNQIKSGGVIFEGDQRWSVHGKDGDNGVAWASMVEYNYAINDEGSRNGYSLQDESKSQGQLLKETFLLSDPIQENDTLGSQKGLEKVSRFPRIAKLPLPREGIVPDSQEGQEQYPRLSKIVKLKLPRRSLIVKLKLPCWRMSWSRK